MGIFIFVGCLYESLHSSSIVPVWEHRLLETDNFPYPVSWDVFRIWPLSYEKALALQKFHVDSNIESVGTCHLHEWAILEMDSPPPVKPSQKTWCTAETSCCWWTLPKFQILEQNNWLLLKPLSFRMICYAAGIVVLRASNWEKPFLPWGQTDISPIFVSCS